MKKKIFYVAGFLLAAILIAGALFLNSLLPIITGYAAKNLCSNVFVSERDPESIEETDLNFSFIKYVGNKVNYKEKSVTSRFLWGTSKAIYREGFGATLIRDVPEEVLRRSVFPVDTDPGYLKDTTTWPLGDLFPDIVSTGIDNAEITDIARKLVDENAYGGNAFAFIVVHKGFPVAAAYKPEFDKNTRFLSWSVAKSFTNALVGLLVKEGRMAITQPVDIAEWKGDDRRSITLNNLLQMQSGLKWNEDYGSRSDINLMLFEKGDMSSFAVSSQYEYPAGTYWNYSSGTANIISALIRQKFESDTLYYAFAQDQFFEKIGITDAVFEVDPSGDFISSSYLYATARDYARFALLYLNDGVFNGERILPEGWVDYTRTPASSSGGKYGAMFWLNRGGEYPDAPEDMSSCEGHDGQRIYIIPSCDLAVIVLGYSPVPDNKMDFDRLLKDIMAAF